MNNIDITLSGEEFFHRYGRKKTVSIFTLGCKVNQYETEAMEEIFEKDGYIVVNSEDIADIYVINTCTVTNLSDRKSRQFISRAKKLNQDAVIAVVGCYSQVSPEEVSKIEGVDVIIGTTERHRILELCKEAKKKSEKINIVKNVNTQKQFEPINIDEIKSKTRAYIKIQDGCNQFCSYCIIPYARGPIRSRRLEEIIGETEKLAKVGFKEIVLAGIHVASYGKDIDKTPLTDVLKAVAKVDGIERIRLSSLEPTLIDEEFMKTIVNIGKVCDHFHLSLQSGSDTVLKRMNRKYTTSQYKDIVNLIRKHMPNAGITTDIIVGFPEETEEEFNQTLEFVKDIRFSKIHVFKYSPRKGTPAAEYKNQIDGNIKNSRSEKLMALGEKLMFEFNSTFVGKTLSVLFEEESKREKNFIEGYTTNYIRVKSKQEINNIGSINDIKIKEAKDDFLIGE
ncbi:tRNA (N(6)-L-threonylcarbamoyladenosine(37)-C(2))-methylthiotransferase MtaB [Tissierella pigra]|uniref:Threonylcarbamoyladenosine tRNA methylthiotransferase MtaB n=1 Tax=Tissierella pigra TaxID=2607614 RepID=A0A6N7XYK2_9FIRM|nr:tRNA (N(6)-L-threonylcarbamoyladenosine(37)-C(2))-methylthiotransferase MtaB [Tissierella pigra]MBU5427115.1 tRNA (N(6)-L-threonylcarbamoyladenosine(37)-C(2))-methylthiotransferase MtaB [Tissierella pigra]MSU02897.1 tRNA (N(6)-L-threonylcarbamoyladenosine(37)-C(2))-methylthiotransferase MtaB [Tissierella pigra]